MGCVDQYQLRVHVRVIPMSTENTAAVIRSLHDQGKLEGEDLEQLLRALAAERAERAAAERPGLLARTLGAALEAAGKVLGNGG